MEEKTVTIDKAFELPFSVIATQNPSDLSGTSMLPESGGTDLQFHFHWKNLIKTKN